MTVTNAALPARSPEPAPARCGFGGAPPRLLVDALAEPPGLVCFFGVDVDLDREFGATNAGAARFVRRNSARLGPLLHRLWPMAFCDVGILQGEVDKVRAEARELAGALSARGHIPAAIGCDHSLSFWLAAGLPGKFTYVYLDAHLDLGFHHPSEAGGTERIHNGNFIAALGKLPNVERVVNIGARSWSGYERCYDSLDAVTRCSMATSELERLVETLRGKRVYVSIDIDVLDPAFVPNTGSPEPFGLTPRELLDVLGSLGRSCTLIGADVSELRADLNYPHTAEVAVRALYQLVGPTRIAAGSGAAT